jgi:CspA family cold shock protein
MSSVCAILSPVSQNRGNEPFGVAETLAAGCTGHPKTLEVRRLLLMDGEMTGTVKWFSRMKGWGFIEPDEGDKDIFVHYENILGDGFRNLEKGERVRFRIEETPRGPKALEVTVTV